MHRVDGLAAPDEPETREASWAQPTGLPCAREPPPRHPLLNHLLLPCP